jgi:hypothetical protein
MLMNPQARVKLSRQAFLGTAATSARPETREYSKNDGDPWHTNPHLRTFVCHGSPYYPGRQPVHGQCAFPVHAAEVLHHVRRDRVDG